LFAAVAWAAPPPVENAASDDGPLLSAFEKQQRLAEQAIRAEVEQQLRDGRARMAAEPATVQKDLALLAGRVFRVHGLSEATRAELRGQIAPLVREARRRALAMKSSTDAKLANRAAAKKVGESDLRLIGPGAEVGVSAPLVADAIDSEKRAKELSDQRTEATGNFYASEERAAVPFADDRPVQYPEAQTWRELTARRREAFGPHHKRFSPAEKEIRKQLETNTEVEFENTPLRDVAIYLADLHGIEVQLDYKGLDWVGVTGETPVTRKIKGVRLKSALRLILGDLDLTYLIANEMLLITTPERAANAVEMRVYPVEDLVFPKTPLEPQIPFGFF
jgi:general secretion pathway protein D